MRTFHQPLLLSIVALAFAGTAYAQVPSSNDTSSTDGNFNTGMGTGALGFTGANGGSFNTAAGYQALTSNTTGYGNTACGYQALLSNMIGYNNTAVGVNAMYFNNGGHHNTASGEQALFANTHGNQNTATGFDALFANKTGNFNTGMGYETLFHATTGTYNVALGWEAGFALTTGSNNIDIGNLGVAAESGTIRIGTQGTQTVTYVAGIVNNTSVSGLGVVVDSNGQLGVVGSSERFKTSVAPMTSDSSKLGQLRPVTFHYKTNPKGALQYGLIAEEVAKVYPELVIRDDKGRIDGVRYDELAPMLLNEVQQQAAEIRELKQQMLELKALHAQ